MNGNLDGGVYGAVMVAALAALYGFFSQRSRGGASRSWKRAALVLAAIAGPAALLLMGGLGS